jgi:hypothetical protein
MVPLSQLLELQHRLKSMTAERNFYRQSLADMVVQRDLYKRLAGELLAQESAVPAENIPREDTPHGA